MTVRLDQTAVKDLKKLDRTTKDKIGKALKLLERSKTTPSSLDIKPLKGLKPWLRLRVGPYRILLRKMDPDTYLVHRIIPRRDLDREAAKLQ